MITADRKHWKGQLAFAHQLLIVDRVLGKRRKLSAERIVNGARLSVQSGVMVAGLVVDAGWGCGQLILRTLLLCSSLAEATVLTGGGKFLYASLVNCRQEIHGHRKIVMQIPLQVTFEGTDPSDAVRVAIERELERLEKHNRHIIGCRVAVIAPSHKHHHGTGAKTAATVRLYPKAILLAELQRDPKIAQAFAAMLARQVMTLRTRLEQRNIHSARDRVRHFLAINADPGGRTVSLSGTLKDIAAELGLTHEALYRTLADMSADGEIERHKGTIRLLKPSV